MSFLTPSSPCRSLDPPGAGRVRAYRGEYFRGVAGSRVGGLIETFAKDRVGGAYFALE